MTEPTTTTTSPSTAQASRSSRVIGIVIAASVAVALVVYREQLGTWWNGADTEPGSAESAADSGKTADDTIDHYTCTMHPSVHQLHPGKCPICGMELVPVTKQQLAQDIVTILPTRQQLIGVRTGRVSSARLVQTVRAAGRLTYDEAALTDVTLKVRGYIVKLFANRTGQRVQKGDPLFSLYSPELYAAEQDFLLAQHSPMPAAVSGGAERPSPMIAAARQRLRLLDLRDDQIDAVAKNGRPLDDVTILAPASGFVIEKNVVQGAAVEAGMRIFRIAALTKVWIEADVYERDLASVRVGQSARVQIDSRPEHELSARIAYIYPYVDPDTRTGRVRLELDNAEGELRPGMYASVLLENDRGTRLQVPSSAVVYTGPRRLVFVDLGEGRWKPTEVQIGAEAAGNYEVLSGLSEGDMVATSGVFLIAAEARIGSAAKYWESSPAGAETTPAASPVADAMPRAEPAVALPKPPTRAARRASAATPRPTASATPPPSAALAAPEDARSSAAPANAPAEKPVIYTCVMHPEIRSPVPGKCPKCGMTLVPMKPEPAP